MENKEEEEEEAEDLIWLAKVLSFYNVFYMVLVDRCACCLSNFDTSECCC